MIDINFFIKSIKAGWVKRIMDTNNNWDWKNICLKQLEKNGGKLIFECNLNLKDLNKSFKIDSMFLLNIMKAWCSLNFYENIKNIKHKLFLCN